MGWYRRFRERAFGSFHGYYASIIAAMNRNSIIESNLIANLPMSSFGPGFHNAKVLENSQSNLWNSSLQINGLRRSHGTSYFSIMPGFNKPRFHEFSKSIFRNISLKNVLKQSAWRSPFLDGIKRFYYPAILIGLRKPAIRGISQSTLKNSLLHGCAVAGGAARGCKQWLRRPGNAFLAVVVGSVYVVMVCFVNLETVPYSKRKRFILAPTNLENEWIENKFNEIKEEYKGEILPPHHQDSVRVQRISQGIIEAMKRGLRKENVWRNDRFYHRMARALTNSRIEEEVKHECGDSLHKEDDFRLQESRKMSRREKRIKAQTAYLEGLKWEVIVVNQPYTANAYCFPGGKIVVFTGILNQCKTDAEIAAIIGHEVGHAVARHSVELITKAIWLIIFVLILFLYVGLKSTGSEGKLVEALYRLPLSRRMEKEADHIGMLLIASAGYDPQVAPLVYKKLGEIEDDSNWLEELLSTHPSGKTRAKLLSRPKVMEKALAMYREVEACPICRDANRTRN